MKRIILIVTSLSLLITACESTNKSKVNSLTVKELMEEYVDCKQSATEKHSCQEYTAMAICSYYGISDFEDPDSPAEYLKYQEISEVIVNSDYWAYIGQASDKESLKRAAEYVESGAPVVAFNSGDTYNHVVVLLKGMGTVSTSWGGIKVPICASFFPNKPEDSFVDRGMNYAFSSPSKVELWVRPK